jgi:hypothetical protein
VSSPLTWGWKHIQFPKRCVFYLVEYRTMGKVQKPSNSEWYTPSSEPFRMYLILNVGQQDWRLLPYIMWIRVVWYMVTSVSKQPIAPSIESRWFNIITWRWRQRIPPKATSHSRQRRPEVSHSKPVSAVYFVIFVKTESRLFTLSPWWYDDPVMRRLVNWEFFLAPRCERRPRGRTCSGR